MTIEDAYNFKRINEHVDTSGMLTEPQLNRLREAGYGAVVNLLPRDSQYAIENEAALIADQGLDYVYIPVDFSAPTEQNYQAFVCAVTAHSDDKLLIHCAANFRVSAFYAIYANHCLGWTVDEAWSHIHSIWSPADYPPWNTFINTRLTC